MTADMDVEDKSRINRKPAAGACAWHGLVAVALGFDVDGAVDGKRPDLRGTGGRVLAHRRAQTNYPQPAHHRSDTLHLPNEALDMRGTIPRRQTDIRPRHCTSLRRWEGQQGEGEGEGERQRAAVGQGARGWQKHVKQRRPNRRGDPFRSSCLHFTVL